MEQLVILVIIGAISLINWLIQKSAERRERRAAEQRADQTGEMPVRPPQNTTQDEMRGLMEALGLPVEEEPPRPIPSEPPPLRLPSMQDLERRLMPEVHPPVEPLPERIIVPAAPIRPPLPPSTAVRKPARKTAAPAPAHPIPTIHELLRSQDGLRKSVLLSEILGPPKGMV